METDQKYRCSRCKAHKAAEEFAPSQRVNGGWCRECHRAYYKAKAPAPPAGFGTCEFCGKEIDNPKDVRRRFCDQNCKQRARYARKNPKLQRTCLTCGADITARRADTKFCSVFCGNKHRNENKTPEQRRAYRLMTTYGITSALYDRMLDEQGGVCAICRTTDPQTLHGFWQVDHCHDTEAVRGLLCSLCNTGLGQFHDNPETLEAAARYLRRPPGG